MEVGDLVKTTRGPNTKLIGIILEKHERPDNTYNQDYYEVSFANGPTLIVWGGYLQPAKEKHEYR